MLRRSLGYPASVCRAFSTRSALRQTQEASSQSSSPAGSVIKAPELAQNTTTIEGLFSESVFNDVWSKQVSLKLDDLKYGISESPIRTNLESCFIESSANEVFLKGNKRTASNMVDEFLLTTTNPTVDQFCKLLEKTATKPTEQYVFQNAATIYNLYYFLSSLKSNPENTVSKADLSELYKTPDVFSKIQNPPEGSIASWIESSFGSIQEFKTLLLATANSTKGNGYTWVVHKFRKPELGQESRDLTRFSSLAILNTYNSGIPLHFRKGQISNARAFKKQQKAVKSDSQDSDSVSMYKIEIPDLEQAQDTYEPLTYCYEPLLAIGNNPSFYLRDYGVFGKSRYLENVWNCIDWDVVESRWINRTLTKKR
ncbi:hypothetical protein OGAPHI_001571 [Ogataea philodendri]|uniref:Manganese/iron superoxide dismutase C-terminal domain-containing protein n=1 Tax=Ogataea philodendri TaxID=1378263 RepID=A0A9P8PD16_9ASCO|nr:uncharacterized protein OGAPHI_001571 [Ogataea philodendri]KAH3669450.1 hypothetical protein OGAPHI_001571 [Ogataea philodendri]